MSKINFKPNEDRVLIQAAEAETKTASGIIIPDTAKEKPQKGTVIAVGEGLKDKPVTVKVGDNVLRQVCRHGDHHRWHRVPHHA